MVKIALKHRLLKSRKLKILEVAKKQLTKKVKQHEEQTAEIPQPQEKQTQMAISHLTPTKKMKPFYSGAKIQVSKGVLYSNYQFTVIFGDQCIKHVMNIFIKGEEEIGNFVVNHKADFIATFTKNYMLRYISLPEKEIQFTHKIDPLFAVDMAFSPEDIFLALGGSNCMVKILNVRKNVVSNEFRVSGAVTKLAWVPIMRKLQLAIATDDRRVTLFDLVTNRVVCAFKDFPSRITALAFDQHILLTSCDKQIRFWDTAVFKQVNVIDLDYEIEALVFDKGFIAGSLTGQLIFKDKVITELQGQEILKLMIDAQILYIVTSELHIYTLDIITHKVKSCMLGYNDEILCTKFIPNNQLLMATNSPFMKIVDLNTMDVIAWKAHYSVIMCCEFRDNLIITGSKDNAIQIFKYNGFKIPQLLFKYTGHSDDVISLDVTSNIIASVSKDTTLKIWSLKDYSSEQSLKTTIAHEKEMNCVRFSPNGKMIATSSQDRSIKLWDSDLNLQLKMTGHKRGVWDVQFSPVEKLLASASGDNTIKIWNIIDGAILKSFQGVQPMLKVMWLCKGTELISGDAAGNLKLWNIKKQTCINTFTEHDGKIYALDIQGGQFVSGADDSLLVIWKDTSLEVNHEEQIKQHQNKLKLQEFQNLMRNKEYIQAALLAFQNNFTKHFIEAVTEIIKAEDNQAILSLSKQLIEEDQVKFLTLLNMLNVSKRTCSMAQLLLYHALRQVKLNLENKEGLKKLLQQLKYTTSKYFDRIDGLYRQTFLTQFMVDKHKIIV